jgi:6-phosphogluconolactonase
MVGMSTIDRRKFAKGLAIAPFAAHALGAELLEGQLSGSVNKPIGRLLFAGTQTKPGTSKGIYTYRLNEDTGELSQPTLAAEVEMPTFLALAPDGRHLFAANEAEDFHGHKSGGVTSFAVNGDKLTPLNAVLAGGTGTCYVSVDQTGRSVFCANYNSGSASSFHVDGSGRLSDAVSNFQYHGHGPVADRQEGPHAHRVTVTPDNNFLLVNDLGLDCIHIYKLNPATARLTPSDPPEWKSAPGSGPRALRFHPNGKFAYCVDELDSSVQVLRWHAGAGTLELVQKLPLTPKGYNGPTSTGCDIVITHGGEFAYVANRGYDALLSFSIDSDDGRMTLLARTGSGGKIPRDLTLSPSGSCLLVANQESDNISVFPRNQQTGLLDESAVKNYPLSRPQCLVFA